MTAAITSSLREYLAEFLGTYVLILIGNGAVAVAVFTGAYDLTGVALLWGLAVMLGVYVAASGSGAHLNPAVTLTFAVFRQFSRGKILPYLGAQVAGAFVASLTLYLCWYGFWERTAQKFGVVVGEPGSQKLLMVFACFYPNPGIVGTGPEEFGTVSTPAAFLVEAVLTMFLLLAIFALIDEGNPGAPQANLAALFIGLAVCAIVGIGAPLTMDAVNPARDFGPRLFGYLAGYGSIAFPGPRGHEWWLYIVAPIVGGLCGGWLYNSLARGRRTK
ncbi:MAG: aquaporin family protein [Acidobacteria bacterium]|nr:aquaporin family protein [Acidobacteriota bacterium]